MTSLDALKELSIRDLQNDSREIKPGDVFLAYPGGAFDGRDFIPNAIKAGAKAVIYEPRALKSPIAVDYQPIPMIPYEGLGEKLGELAKVFYHVPKDALDIVGITGTNGKTTIAYLLAQAYNLLGTEAAYLGTLGAGVLQKIKPMLNTTPDALYVQRFLHQCFTGGVKQVAMEVSSHALCMHRVDEVPFTQAVYTNLSHEHLDFHKTIDAYAEAKSKLFAYSSLESVVINTDDAYASCMIEVVNSHVNRFTYGVLKPADIMAKNIKLHAAGSIFDAKTPWGDLHCEISLLGRFNIYNTLAVIGSLLARGLTTLQVESVLPKLAASPGRMEQVSSAPIVLVDYAHTPDALEKALSTLNELKAAGRLIVVFGCGGDRDTTKRPLMGEVAAKLADVLIVTSDNPRTEEPLGIIKDITKNLTHQNILTLESREAAILKALEVADERDIILIAGKGHESYQEIGTTRIPFSDQDIVRQHISP